MPSPTAGLLALVHALVAPPPGFIALDFSTATTGRNYTIEFCITTPTGATVVSGPIRMGNNATTEDVRDAFAAALGVSGLTVTPAGTTGLVIEGAADARLGRIAYYTTPATLAGPRAVGQGGRARLVVNDAVAKPGPGSPAPALLGLRPFEARLDFTALPAKGTARYDLAVLLETAGGDPGLAVVAVVREAGPNEAVGAICAALERHGWTVRRDGLTVRVRGKGPSPIRRVLIEPKGVGAGVSWVIPRNED